MQKLFELKQSISRTRILKGKVIFCALFMNSHKTFRQYTYKSRCNKLDVVGMYLPRDEVLLLESRSSIPSSTVGSYV